MPPIPVTVITPSSSLQLGTAVTDGVRSIGGAMSTVTVLPQPLASFTWTVCVPEVRFEIVNGGTRVWKAPPSILKLYGAIPAVSNVTSMTYDPSTEVHWLSTVAEITGVASIGKTTTGLETIHP